MVPRHIRIKVMLGMIVEVKDDPTCKPPRINTAARYFILLPKCESSFAVILGKL